MQPYQADLAFIHDDGFDQFARAAAEELQRRLAAHDLTTGLVIDLGCGGGVTAAALHGFGFTVQGVDLAPAHIEMARQRVPAGEFIQSSFLDHALKPCVAVTAIGEVLNYTFDPRSDEASLKTLFKRIHAALQPGGCFLFDCAGPHRLAGLEYREANFSGKTWDIQVRSTISNEGQRLERQIIHFTRQGELYRRSEETHQLNLYAPDDIHQWLVAAGFEVERFSAYRETVLPDGLVGFLGVKRN